MKKITTTIAIAAIAFFCSGCDSFLSIGLSPQLIESADLTTDITTAQSAVDGIYTYMRSANPMITNGAPAIYGGLAADELRPSADNAIYGPFYENAILPDNSYIASQLWSPAYNMLYRCNSLIAQMEASMALPGTARNRLVAELIVARAFQYVYLTGFFGGVPLVLTPDYTINATLPRVDDVEILRHLAADLQRAQQLFLDGEALATKTRPTYWAATALLARISLYLGDHEGAIRYSSDVIANGPFRLSADLETVFGIGGPETIWEIAPPNNTGNTPEGGAFLPGSVSTLSPLLLTDAVVRAFEPGDGRLAQWVGRTGEGSGTVYYPRKYRYPQPGATFEYSVVLRMAEQYLIRAEAYLAEGAVEDARRDLNALRGRAEATLLRDGMDAGALRDTLRTERQRELFAEWGHRWFDLRRWGIIDDVMPQAKVGWQSHQALFPIPENQLFYNYRLTQNPGY